MWFSSAELGALFTWKHGKMSRFFAKTLKSRASHSDFARRAIAARRRIIAVARRPFPDREQLPRARTLPWHPHVSCPPRSALFFPAHPGHYSCEKRHPSGASDQNASRAAPRWHKHRPESAFDTTATRRDRWQQKTFAVHSAQ